MKLTGKSSNLIGKNFTLKIGPRVDTYSYDNGERIKLYPLHDGKDDTRMTYDPVTEVWTCTVDPITIAGHEDYTDLYVFSHLLGKNVANKGSLTISTVSSGYAFCKGRYSNQDVYLEEGSSAKLSMRLSFAKYWANVVEGDTHYTVAVLKDATGTVLKVDKQNFVLDTTNLSESTVEHTWEVALLPNTATVELYTLSGNTKDEACPVVSAPGDDYAYALKWKMRGIKNIHWYAASSVPDPLPFIEGLVATISVNGVKITAGIQPDGTVRTYQEPTTYFDLSAAAAWTNIVYLAINASGLFGLKADGTLVTTDVNSKDIETSTDWTNLKQLACTRYGIVGLKNDGTVVTNGYNNNGDMSTPPSWTNIKKIRCLHSATVGLKNDGTVVFAGTNTYGVSGCASWTNIKDIFTGPSNVVGIYTDTNSTSEYGHNWYGLADINLWKDIKQVILTDVSAVGVKTDGSIVSVGNASYIDTDLIEIPNIISWFADDTFIGVVDCHGAVYYRTNDIKNIAAGSPGTWTLNTVPETVTPPVEPEVPEVFTLTVDPVSNYSYNTYSVIGFKFTGTSSANIGTNFDLTIKTQEVMGGYWEGNLKAGCTITRDDETGKWTAVIIDEDIDELWRVLNTGHYSEDNTIKASFTTPVGDVVDASSKTYVRVSSKVMAAGGIL